MVFFLIKYVALNTLNQKMCVIFDSADGDGHAAEILDDTANVGVKAVAPILRNTRQSFVING